jgi:SAM-dependent methyltransferase
VLELGCGSGRDTTTLDAAGSRIAAADISEMALRDCARRVPRAGLVRLDILRPLPFKDRSFPVVIASLSLHYFTWPMTIRIVEEIDRCLYPGGALIARLNSTEDVHHGAAATEEIEPGLKLVNGSSKRFFDRTAVITLLAGWKICFLEHSVIDRYHRPKAVWEAMARRPESPESGNRQSG